MPRGWENVLMLVLTRHGGILPEQVWQSYGRVYSWPAGRAHLGNLDLAAGSQPEVGGGGFHFGPVWCLDPLKPADFPGFALASR